MFVETPNAKTNLVVSLGHHLNWEPLYRLGLKSQVGSANRKVFGEDPAESADSAWIDKSDGSLAIFGLKKLIKAKRENEIGHFQTGSFGWRQKEKLLFSNHLQWPKFKSLFCLFSDLSIRKRIQTNNLEDFQWKSMQVS